MGTVDKVEFRNVCFNEVLKFARMEIQLLVGSVRKMLKLIVALLAQAMHFTAFISSVAEGIFFFYSHRADNRFIKGIVGTYEVSISGL